MFVLSSSLLLASAAISPGLGRLESLAVQHFGKANAAPFLHMNRKLQDLGGDEGSGNNGDITEMCDNEQFGTFCAMSDDELASSMSNMAMSANNGAASGAGARFLTAESDAQLCALKSMKSFYCGSLCDTTCKSFLSSGGDGQALTASSSNDESNVESNDAPSFMSNESELNKVCSSSCLMDLLKSMTGMMESLSKCGGEGLSALSSNDGAASNPGLPSDPTAEIEQQLGRICVKNDKNKYCMSEFLAFGKKTRQATNREAHLRVTSRERPFGYGLLLRIHSRAECDDRTTGRSTGHERNCILDFEVRRLYTPVL